MPDQEKYFSPSHFTATPTSTAAFKSQFATHLARFITAGCPSSLFHMWFYERLSNCFGHTACSNRDLFYYHWCITREKQLAFLEVIMTHPCYGDPSATFSDVERQVQVWARDNRIQQRLLATMEDPPAGD